MLRMTSNISMLIFYVCFACVFLMSVHPQVAVVVTEPDSEQLEDNRVQPTDQVESIDAGNSEP